MFNRSGGKDRGYLGRLLEERMQRVMPGFVDVLRSATMKVGSRNVIAMCEDSGLEEVCAVVRRIAAKIDMFDGPESPADAARGDG